MICPRHLQRPVALTQRREGGYYQLCDECREKRAIAWAARQTRLGVTLRVRKPKEAILSGDRHLHDEHRRTVSPYVLPEVGLTTRVYRSLAAIGAVW